MFGRKKAEKVPPEANAYIQRVITEAPSIIYIGVVGNQIGSELTAKLELDEQQRVVKVSNLAVDGNPKVPAPNLLETLNQLTTPIASFPETMHLKSIDVRVTKDGQFDTNFDYKLKA